MVMALEAHWACTGLEARPVSLVGRLPGENLFCGGGSLSTSLSLSFVPRRVDRGKGLGPAFAPPH